MRRDSENKFDKPKKSVTRFSFLTPQPQLLQHLNSPDAPQNSLDAPQNSLDASQNSLDAPQKSLNALQNPPDVALNDDDGVEFSDDEEYYAMRHRLKWLDENRIGRKFY